MTLLIQGLQALSEAQLKGIRRGIEKESLRVLPGGALASTPHPAALGSALKHPHITTDFSESQLELVTGAHANADRCIEQLTEIHQYVYRVLAAQGDERLWVSSMPCRLPADDEIPIGRYGRSNVGQAKSVYRTGLGYRYGRRMQTISGIHYNWSMPGVSSEDYFALIRNFRRRSFLLLYLFGASPAVCPDFVRDRPHQLEPLGPHTLHLPHATSLRMGRLGYQSDAQSTLAVSYNSLETYGASLHDALTRPYPPYEAIGVTGPDGQYRQLATSLLQIENEFYGTIRPKRVIFPGERPLHALRERGVEYVEVRCMDLDPFEPVGISAQTARFLDIFLLHCLLSESPPDTPDEIAALGRNQHHTATHGRAPGLRLERNNLQQPLDDWADELMADFQPIAERLDAIDGGELHQAALDAARRTVRDPERLPSARVIAAIRDALDGGHNRFTDLCSEKTREQLMALPWSDDAEQRHRALAARSVDDQREIEAMDSMPFELYRQEYLAPYRLEVPAH
ncbi:glutamate--cysteine ligase [Piscinibacter sakaiensis]|uniref:glutamate--cysteine ligase n=1 Tax=Piscinibacter sakaiensis TaxID=1547922 RepID=UPI003AAD3B2A